MVEFKAMPAYMRRLAEVYDVQAFLNAQRFFHDRGVNLAYVPRRGWRFYCIGRQDGPTYVCCWVGLGALVDMLDAPSATLKAIHEKGGAVRL
jgi:hypothetical protein